MDLKFEQDVVLARQRARQISAELKCSAQEQTRLATAVSEIARNAFNYGKAARVAFFIDAQHKRDRRRDHTAHEGRRPSTGC